MRSRGHLVHLCPYNNENNSRGRIEKPKWLGGRIRGSSYNRGSWNQTSDWSCQRQNRNDFSSQRGFSDKKESSPLVENPFSASRFDNTRWGGLYLNETRFRCTLLKWASKESQLPYGFWATHNFLLDKILFIGYVRIARETVVAAFGAPRFIIGKGMVRIPIEGGRTTLTYYAPEFDTHILSVRYTAIKLNLRKTFGIYYLGYAENSFFSNRAGTKKQLYSKPNEKMACTP